MPLQDLGPFLPSIFRRRSPGGTYLTSVQLIEPAVAYTIGAGVMPLTAYLAYRARLPEGEPLRNRSEALGNLILLAGVGYLVAVTLMGWSGFVRGGTLAAAGGVFFAVADGVLTAIGPFVIFGLQMVEGRVDYSTPTLVGLFIYFAGALLAALGAVRATVERPATAEEG